ncbi:hypothetical protein [Niveibacterium sp. SC-1]|uniref:Lrp/AsnC family transcriptional regulator n=1 Tax=Niveibacterium sp. SC-1 TaxID=3135646 RepID=UPI0031201ECF
MNAEAGSACPRGLPSLGGPVDILSLLGGGWIDADTSLDARLLAHWQEGLPLCERPFEAIAAACGCEEREVLQALRRMVAQGLIAHVGAVLTPAAFGASTLVGLKVEPRHADAMAGYLCLLPEIARADLREHEYNLWFVLSADTRQRLDASLAQIRGAVPGELLDLPLRELYQRETSDQVRTVRFDRLHVLPSLSEGRLLGALRDSLPLVPRPFARLGMRADMGETQVLRTLGRWLANGAIRRLGLVLRPRLLGAAASAMCAWGVEEGEARAAGQRLAALPQVRLVYRRAPQPGWPYNLYCGIHANGPAGLEETRLALARAAGLAQAPSALMPLRRHCRRQEGRRPL